MSVSKFPVSSGSVLPVSRAFSSVPVLDPQTKAAQESEFQGKREGLVAAHL